MITLRRGGQRGVTAVDWLDSKHTFSFGEYHDPAHTRFRTLRVINDDVIGPGGGFPAHPHRDMEILTYVLSGSLAHEDSMGNREVIRAGEWQKMTAGTGVRHAEFNGSQTEPVHLLQIWVFPDKSGYAPGYAQRVFPDAEKRGRWRTIAAPGGANDSLTVNQDLVLSAAVLHEAEALEYPIAPGRGLWVHVATGAVLINGHFLQAGDAVAVEDEPGLKLLGQAGGGEVLVFDAK